MTELAKHTWKSKIHEVIYEADTPAGKIFDVILLIIILLSVVLVMLESVAGMQIKYGDYFYISEWIITIFFTIEYILRVISIKKASAYVFSFYGLIDFISTIPLYLSFFIVGTNALLTIRALRLLRVFRILKITRYIGEGNKLTKALKDSRPKILVFLFAVMILSVIAGTLMYIVEGPEHGFNSIPVSVYWCIVTLTTVGFGDIAPVTALGQFIAMIIMVLGYGIIAVPTGIVSAEMAKKEPGALPEHKLHINTQVCHNCGARKHQDSAKYCHNCGNSLHYE
ncbi:ion transporter [Leeuwenhoekiella aequorea]|uniref:Voltage-gated potassium channel n=1 Tax=Leeuwenhoekiella aequorea TaxID=283736 RepID=A0A4Q0P959_9FLAO|nr:ion transporter [Leeuwenhoekiella aequorea]RXG23244.1 voltage-gated potassium channel [Leeuwenhoekiella aequorea]